MNICSGKFNPLRLTPLLAGAGLATLLALSPASARAQGATVLALYSGNTVQTEGIQLSSWGSGAITEEPKVLYSGSESLKLVTHGLYQGASLTFMKPVDLGPYLTNKSAYLQFVLMPPAEPNATGAGGFSPGKGGGFGPPGYPGGPPGAGGQRGGFPGGYPGGTPGGYGGFGKGGQTGGTTTGSVKFQTARSLEHVRVLLITSGGKSVELFIPMTYAVDDNQWKLMSYPVASIPGLKAEDAQIKEIRLFGDMSGTIYVGKIGVVTDTNKIRIDPQDEKIVNPNVKYRYNVSAKGGITPLQYSWDWDDKDGIQDESQGRSVTHTFRKSGDFKVTVTVTDPYGVKAPATMKFNVHVP